MRELEARSSGAGDLVATLTWCGAEALVVAEGDIDAFTSSTLRRLLDEAVDGPARRLTVDIRGVGFMGTAGYQLLVATRRRLAARDAPMHVVGASHTIRSLGARVGLELGPPLR
jgi:anti-sigma B factor antagonist